MAEDGRKRLTGLIARANVMREASERSDDQICRAKERWHDRAITGLDAIRDQAVDDPARAGVAYLNMARGRKLIDSSLRD